VAASGLDSGGTLLTRSRATTPPLACPAGGEGKQLAPLTVPSRRCRSAGDYRLVDFVLSNLVNGGY